MWFKLISQLQTNEKLRKLATKSLSEMIKQSVQGTRPTFLSLLGKHFSIWLVCYTVGLSIFLQGCGRTARIALQEWVRKWQTQKDFSRKVEQWSQTPPITWYYQHFYVVVFIVLFIYFLPTADNDDSGWSQSYLHPLLHSDHYSGPVDSFSKAIF